MRRFFLLLAMFPLWIFAADISQISKEIYTFNQTELEHIRNIFHIQSFIETGTAGGETTELAANLFPEVHSVEIFESNYHFAKTRLAKFHNVHLYLGDSCLLLKDLITHSSPRRLYWLDAHCSGAGTGGIPGFSPIPIELEIVQAYGSIEDVIMIDDLRGMFYNDERSTLPLREMHQQIKQMNPDYELYVIGDIALVFNRSIYPSLSISPLTQACTTSMMLDPTEQTPSYWKDVITQEFVIAASNPQTFEGEKIIKLYKRFYASSGGGGGETIYALWKALQDMGHHHYREAANLFQAVLKTPFKHWRISAYLTRALCLDGRYEEAREEYQRSLTGIDPNNLEALKLILTTEWIEFLK